MEGVNAKYDGRGPRLIGETTRLIDRYIQELFINGEVLLIDHASGQGLADKDLQRRFINRLNLEHPLIAQHLIANKYIEGKGTKVSLLIPNGEHKGRNVINLIEQGIKFKYDNGDRSLKNI